MESKITDNNALLQKINELLGSEKELIVLKGKMFMPEQEHKVETGEAYYTFKIKVLKASNNDEYAQNYNTYFCVMPAEVSKGYSTQNIAEMKNNEVLLLCSARASTRTFQKSDTPDKVTVNNISLYVLDIMLTRQIDSAGIVKKALKI